MPRHEAVGGPEPAQAAERRGSEDRPRGLGADGEGHEPRRRRRPRSARRPAAPVVGVPGRAPRTGEARVGIVVPHASRELDHRELAQEHRPRLVEALDDRGVVVEDLLPVGLRAPGGGNALRGQEILGPVRDAVEGTAVLAREQLLVRAVGLGESELARHRHHGAQARADRLQPPQVAFGQLHRGEPARPERGPEVAHRREEDVLGDHLRASLFGRAEKAVAGSSPFPSFTARSRSPASRLFLISRPDGVELRRVELRAVARLHDGRERLRHGVGSGRRGRRGLARGQRLGQERRGQERLQESTAGCLHSVTSAGAARTGWGRSARP